MTAQEVSTMIRYGLNPIIFLINNGGYTIEVEIHDGPYNTIKNWDYAGLVDVFNATDGNGWSARVTTQNQLDAMRSKSAIANDGPQPDRSQDRPRRLQQGPPRMGPPRRRQQRAGTA